MNEELYSLIRKAQGDRSQNEFALDCKINPSTLTRIMQGLYKVKVDVIKKIADGAEGRVTFTELLNAAGYETENTEGLSGLYLRLAKGAQDLQLDEQDVDYILDFYAKYKK